MILMKFSRFYMLTKSITRPTNDQSTKDDEECELILVNNRILKSKLKEEIYFNILNQHGRVQII